MPAEILLVEDERAQREPLARYLERCGYRVDAAASGEQAEECLAACSYRILITDLRLPGIDGLELIRRACARFPELGVLLITAYASVESAIDALRLGAHDYLLKPLLLDDVGRKVQNLLQLHDLTHENAQLRRALHAQQRGPALVAESPAMREVAAWIERAAASRANVLIVGETGTGKEVTARAIHDHGPDRDQPFVPIDVASIPRAILESELFGYERGAFTGATRPRDGLLRSAGRGTVFLDEVCDLPLAVQATLLRALETSSLKPLGSDNAVPFEARIIASTHRNLEQAIESRKFREDLYYILNVLRISLPALRERPEDIPPLVQHLLARHPARSHGATGELTGVAMSALCNHVWRGNVRELSNVLERASMLAAGAPIDIEHLPPDVTDASGAKLRLQEAMDRYERSYISMVLRLCGGNRDRAARELGVSPATLYRRLDRHSLKTEKPCADDSQR